MRDKEASFRIPHMRDHERGEPSPAGRRRRRAARWDSTPYRGAWFFVVL